MKIDLTTLSIFIIAAAVSAVFSGSETGIYQLTPLKLRINLKRKHIFTKMLTKLMLNRPALLVSILIGTNLANIIATSSITRLFLNSEKTHHSAEMLATLIATPILFIFAEVVPKNIFFLHAETLMPLAAPVLTFFHKLFTFTGLLPMLKAISSRITKFLSPDQAAISFSTTSAKISHIKAILQETHQEDLLSPLQTEIISRLDTISNLSVTSVMTPLPKVVSAEINSDRNALLDILKKYPYTRIPIYKKTPDNINSYVNIYQPLTSPRDFQNLREFEKPILKLEHDTILADAISIMQREKQKIVLITKTMHTNIEKPLGLITMKDLVEELIGDLAQW